MGNIIDKKDVLHIANLSKLSFGEDEADRFTGELNNILDYIRKLEELDTDNVPPTSHVLDIKNVFRDDIVKDQLSSGDALKNAPENEHDHIKVPRVIEG